jgi:hypothetical protein
LFNKKLLRKRRGGKIGEIERRGRVEFYLTALGIAKITCC